MGRQAGCQQAGERDYWEKDSEGAGGRLGVKSQATGGICRDARAPAASDIPGAARERRAVG